MFFRAFLLATLIVLSSVVNTSAIFGYYPNTRVENSSELSRAKWDQIGPKFQNVLQPVIDEIWPRVNSSDEFSKLSHRCKHSIQVFVEDLKDLKLWAIQMLDATPFWAGGRTFGGWSAYGAYDQCLDITKGHSNSENEVPFPITGQYCIVDFRPPLPPHNEPYRKPKTLPGMENFHSKYEFVEELAKRGWQFNLRAFRYGACVPSTCTQEDIEFMANGVAQYVNFNAMVPWCETKEPKVLGMHLIITMGALATFIVMGVACTLIDCFKNRNRDLAQLPEKPKGLFIKIINSFSITRNVKIALMFPKTYPPTAHLHGLKVISIVWIFCNHTSLLLFFAFSFNDQERYINYTKGISEQLFANGLIAVDIFLFMTSFITTYALLQPKNVDKKPGFVPEVIVPFFKRAIKLLVITLLATAVIFVLVTVGSGPFYQFMVGHYENVCRSTWWYILFFGTNFQDVDKTCVAASWYVSADIQLFAICLLYIFMYKRNRTLSLLIITVLMAVSLVSNALIQHYQQNPPTMLLTGTDIPNWVKYFTDNHYPQDHLFPYGAGILLGTLLSHRQKFKISNWKIMVGWIVSLSLNGYVLFASLSWNNGVEYTQIESLIYITLQKPILAIGLFWLSFVCATGHANLLNKILSAKIFAMVGKLVLILFLINLSVISVMIGQLDTTITSKKFFCVGYLIYILLITCVLSAVLHLLYEIPISELLNILTGESRKPESRDEDSKETQIDDTEAAQVTTNLRAVTTNT